MKFLLLSLIISIHFLPVFSQQQHLTLNYKTPAKDWNEALPIGNGRLGAMIFGGTAEELIQRHLM
ncbi:MAG: glycoside hydrolase N-terminal domain-containing protein [Gemmatimonadaceae bacterium]|nr:glycoside hydrolase N-terminal domain-containing protein [Chitinophagaceae bacterium]